MSLVPELFTFDQSLGQCFSLCSELHTVINPKSDTSIVKLMEKCFTYRYSWKLSSVIDISSCFKYCHGLKIITLYYIRYIVQTTVIVK